MKNQEFIIWGFTENGKEEEILLSEKSELRNYAHAVNAGKYLEQKYNCKNTRVQIIDFSSPVNFVNAINK